MIFIYMTVNRPGKHGHINHEPKKAEWECFRESMASTREVSDSASEEPDHWLDRPAYVFIIKLNMAWCQNIQTKIILFGQLVGQ